MKDKRWQDWVMLVFGLWLIVSPFILPYNSFTGMAAWVSYLFGIAVAAIAIVALFYPRMWEEGVNLVLGIALIAMPFLLQYSGEEILAARNHFILGILIAADALWVMLQQFPTHKRKATG